MGMPCVHDFWSLYSACDLSMTSCIVLRNVIRLLLIMVQQDCSDGNLLGTANLYALRFHFNPSFLTCRWLSIFRVLQRLSLGVQFTCSKQFARLLLLSCGMRLALILIRRAAQFFLCQAAFD